MENNREMFNKSVGITAEFDPFHLGHRYLLRAVRRAFPERGIICVMSGQFTQRGSAAAVDKLARAEMALRGGADLILELPVLWASASAETFARGAVQCLLDTGVVDTLAFGSEAGELSQLRQAAETLDSEAYQPLLRAGLDQGLSFAAARQRAAEALSGAAGSCLAGANNNLGVEYLRVLRYWGRPELNAFTVPRRGAAHGSLEEESPMVSASRLRAWMAEGAWERLEGCLPPESLALLLREQEQGSCPARLERCESGILARLRAMTEDELTQLPDWEPGLERRLSRAARESVTLAELYDRAKTRRCPEARVRRMVLWAFLGLTPEQRPERVPYLRVLGCNDRGRSLLRAMKKTASLPILTKPGQVRYLDETARQVFSLEARGDDLWRLCLPQPEQRRGGREWLRGPVILENPD